MKRPYDAIIWWEIRRIPFNIILFVVGLLAIIIAVIIGDNFVEPGEDVIEPALMIVGSIFYGVIANICYTMGWVTELLWSDCNTSLTESIRPKIFRKGLVFSIVITFSPAILWIIIGSISYINR